MGAIVSLLQAEHELARSRAAEAAEAAARHRRAPPGFVPATDLPDLLWRCSSHVAVVVTCFFLVVRPGRPDDPYVPHVVVVISIGRFTDRASRWDARTGAWPHQQVPTPFFFHHHRRPTVTTAASPTGQRRRV